MAVIIVNELPAEVGADAYLRVGQIIGAGGPVDGMIFHCGFVKGDRIQVVDCWESRAHFEAFANGRLGAAIGEVMGPEAMQAPPDFGEYATLDLVTQVLTQG